MASDLWLLRDSASLGRVTADIDRRKLDTAARTGECVGELFDRSAAPCRIGERDRVIGHPRAPAPGVGLDDTSAAASDVAVGLFESLHSFWIVIAVRKIRRSRCKGFTFSSL